jgi:hypothetical protein
MDGRPHRGAGRQTVIDENDGALGAARIVVAVPGAGAGP